MSDLTDLLDAIRGLYLRRFEEVRAELAASGRKFILEPALLNAEGEIVREGPVHVGMRLDAMSLSANGSYEKVPIDSDKAIVFEPAVLDYGGLAITILPFQWDYFHLRTDGDSAVISNVLGAWFDQVFLAEAATEDDESVQGVAHFMSDPVNEGGMTACILDLGTASVSALESLFDRLRDAGASRVELGPTQT